MHPTLDVLLQFSNCSLGGSRERKVEKHLAKCEDCRRWAAHLRLHAAPVEKWQVRPVEEVLSGIRRWAADRSAEPDGVKMRVAAEIGRYLGPRAADRILEKVPDQHLLSSIEPVLADFLGRRAAQHLVEHVVDRAIVRT
jgi:hypothetical protein